MRIVSLACSNTEILWALGLESCLVGVDDHSDFPAEALEHLPRVGPDLNIDVAKVAALEPDLVLASLTVPGHEEVVEGLARAGLPFLAPEPVSIDDVYANVRQIALAMGAETRGEEVVGAMKQELRPVNASMRPEVLVQWWPRPVIAPCRDSWVTDLMAAAGGSNPLGARPGKSAPLSDEEVVALDPEAVVLAWCGVDPAKYRPEVVYRKASWQKLQAVRKRRVYCVPEAFLGRPGPRLTHGFHALKEIIDAVRADRSLASATENAEG